MEVTLTLKDTLYERFREIAEHTNRPIEEIIEEKLSEVLKTTDPNDVTFDPMEREMAAYAAMHAELEADYLDEFVAITDGQLVDHDKDPNGLMRRLKARYPKDKVIHVTKVRPIIQQTLFVRSPRFIRDEE